MTPWTLLFLAASVGTDGSAEAPIARHDAPPGAICVRGPRPLAWRPIVTSPAAVGSAGLRIDIDPERAATVLPGREALQAHAAREAALEDLRAEVLADGSLRLVVGDLLQSYSVMRFDAAGRPLFDCAHSALEADQLSRRPVPSRVREDK